ncbi:septation protein IspZ [Ascidiaceihabitans sp.]|jgi:intracellular septation protein|nr:septation protein IspZ [Ascidiaceihabitans sp.]MDB4211583.1 septation protein IspZ [Ascidiaceihabitans sp.]MDB9945803.1 septation protein IspZ [Ascidiaceihabitans sp.]MDC1275312.1 septation protein IspZ [Ascidiaceihabitans sp.]
MSTETSGKEINPFVKLLLEMGPIVLFFIAYMRMKDNVYTISGTEYDGFILVTAGFVLLLIATTGLLWFLTGKLSRMQIATLVMVVLFGGMTVWLNDDRFIKMKPTMIYLLFGATLGFGLLRGSSYLQYVMEGMMPLQDAGWMILTKRLMIFFFGLAILNELIWRTSSTETWVYFKTFGLTLAMFGFFMTQSKLLQTYSTDEESSDKS